MLTPRDYQVEADRAIEAAHAAGMRRPAVVLPTGAGKTIVLAKYVANALEDGSGGRSLVLAHRDELINQAFKKIRSALPNAYVGIVKGTRDQVGADIVVASVQTLRHDARLRRVRNVRRIVVDECHHATAPSYRKILGHYGAIDDGTSAGRSALALGLTATMSRGDKSALGDIWEDVVYKKSIKWMIRRGYLVKAVGKLVRVENFNLANVKKTAGDYQLDSLGEELTQSLAPKRIVEAHQKEAADRPTVLFSPTVAFAELMCEEFRIAGYTSAVIHAKSTDREQILEDFEAAKIQILCNCMVLTEGTDLPRISCIILARATTHQGLYIQMVGRGLRPDKLSGKTDCLVLDVAGASLRHALSAEVDMLGVDDDSEQIDGDTDEILDEMLDAESDEFGEDEPAFADGPIVTEDVDLFHGALSAWNTTYAGVHYIRAGDRYLALVPGWNAGEWDVASIGTRFGTGSRWINRGVPDIGYAMAYAEDDVQGFEATLAHKDRRWRKAPATAKALSHARRMRLIVPEGATGGQVSDLISRVEASERIDAGLPAYARGRLVPA